MIHKMKSFFANGVDPDEMQHYAVFHLGLQFLQKYSFRGFPNTKGWAPTLFTQSLLNETNPYLFDKTMHAIVVC